MFSEITIENFKCFEKLELKDLGRVNLIVGPNNVGKTALLEAVQLLAEPLRTTANQSNILRADAYSQDLNRDRSAWLRSRLRNETETPEFSINGKWGNELRSVFVRIGSSTPAGGKFEEIPSFGNNLFNFLPKSEVITGHILGNRMSYQEESQIYAEISELKDYKESLKIALQKLDNRIVGHQLGLSDGRVIFHVDFGGPRTIPIDAVGDGVMQVLRLCSVLFLSVFKKDYVGSRKTGAQIILIDEIEQGLYHSAFEGIFEILCSLTRKFSLQLFATTHSEDCVKAAVEVFKEKAPEDFRLIRFVPTRNGLKVPVVHLDTVETAIGSGLDVR